MYLRVAVCNNTVETDLVKVRGSTLDRSSASNLGTVRGSVALRRLCIDLYSVSYMHS